MSDITVSPVGLSHAQRSISTPLGRATLRKTVGEVVGTTFVGEMLKIAHNSRLEGKYGHGGRGERVFRGQLDQQFAQMIGARMQNGVTESICKRLSRQEGA
jgi:Rod binding domain-containing protein